MVLCANRRIGFSIRKVLHMSTNPEAIIYYGFPLKGFREEIYDEDYNAKNDEWLYDRRPKEPECDRTVKGYYKTPEWDVWRSKLREWEQTLENVEIDWSGVENCETYYLHCPGIALKAEWNSQVLINCANTIYDEKANQYLKEFCEQFNLPYQDPSWWLAVRYF